MCVLRNMPPNVPGFCRPIQVRPAGPPACRMCSPTCAWLVCGIHPTRELFVRILRARALSLPPLRGSLLARVEGVEDDAQHG